MDDVREKPGLAEGGAEAANRVGPRKVNNWHQALSDFMIQHPEMRAYDVALVFGVTEAWLSTVKNSDAFKQFHDARRKEHFDRISTTVVDKVQALAEISVDELTARVETEREDMSVQALHDVSKLALQALGFGGRQPQVQINDNRQVVVGDTEALQRSREVLKSLRARNDEVIEHQTKTPELPSPTDVDTVTV